jgi:hypothetical protein
MLVRSLSTPDLLIAVVGEWCEDDYHDEDAHERNIAG